MKVSLSDLIRVADRVVIDNVEITEFVLEDAGLWRLSLGDDPEYTFLVPSQDVELEGGSCSAMTENGPVAIEFSMYRPVSATDLQ